nr:MAG TPA: hypothetical protein [Caudoviricetes sp.]
MMKGGAVRPRPFVRKRLQLAVTGRNWQQLAKEMFAKC